MGKVLKKMLPLGLLVITPLTWAKTSMEDIVSQYNISHCASALVTVANETIRDNQHRLLPGMAKVNVNRHLISVTGVIQYRDRQSHIRFTAMATPNEKTHCDINFQETYVVKSTCILAREEVFKKWLYQGQLNSETMVFHHKRDKDKVGYLSSASDGSFCLISQQKSLQF